MEQKRLTPVLDAAEERTWAIKARNGDAKAFAVLVRAYTAPLYNLAVRMINNRCEAEELVQETFLKAYSGLAGFDPERRFYSWLYAICLNTVRDAIRKNGQQPPGADQDPESLSLRSERGTEERILHQEQLERLLQAIEMLPRNIKEPLVLKYFQELTFPELAEICGLTERVAKSRVYKGLSLLQQELVDENRETLNMNDRR